MWSEDKIEKYLQDNITEKRYKHVLGVVAAAEKLAKLYGANVKEARLAAYIHDAAKYTKATDAISFLEKRGYSLSEEDKSMPELLHGLVGAIIGRDIMAIPYESVFNAARYHTTGRENMTLLEKVIFVADYIEPSRNFPGVMELRQLACEDLDRAIIKAYDNTIKYVIDGGKLIHTDTIRARNYLLSTMSQENSHEHNIR